MTEPRRNGLRHRLVAAPLLAALVLPVLASGGGAAVSPSPPATRAPQAPEAGPLTEPQATEGYDRGGEQPGSDAADALMARLEGLERFQASFTQTIRGARGELLERSSGTIRLLRPLFRWDVDAPYPQTIVAAEGRLQVYDPDLEQLIVRPLDEALTDTPVALLTQDDLLLRDDYQITRLADDAGDSYRLRPRDPEALFESIALHFGPDTLIGLDILDRLGQETRIRFAPGADAGALEAADFELEVPPGTDVLGG